MLVDKQNELMSDLLFTVHQHGGDDVKWKPPIARPPAPKALNQQVCQPKCNSRFYLEGNGMATWTFREEKKK